MKRIVHVDHSEFFRKFMRNFLKKEGFEAESFSSAQESSVAISGGIADMVIVGLTFADAEGEEFLKNLQDAYSGPVIVLSSSVDDRRDDLLRLGVTDAISKTDAWQERLRFHLAAL
ncbi:MAG: response regulator [Treponema sp.]|nr:response regulator [Treponema sp.]